MRTLNEVTSYYSTRYRKRWSVEQNELSQWYWEAVNVYGLKGLTYAGFESSIKRSQSWRYKRTRYVYQAEDRYPICSRQPYTKKTLTEDQVRKREWRNKVKPPGKHKPWRYGSGSKSYVKLGRRAARRDMTAALKKENWEEYRRGYWEPVHYVTKGEDGRNYWHDDTDLWSYEYCQNDWDNFIEKDRKPFVDPWDWY